MELKTFNVKDVVFDDDAGTVSAAIATLGVVDKDGDVTLPGFFGEQETAIAHAHDRSKVGGKGRIYEDGDLAVFTGTYFLETIEGREQYLTAKAMGDLQEWSYGFHLYDDGSEIGDFDGRRVRFLKARKDGSPGARIAEVSTVLVGAGEGTRTLAMKDHGLRFVEQAEQTAQAVELLLGRAEEIAALRAEKGTTLGDEAVARLLDVKTRLAHAADMFGTLTTPEPETDNYAVTMLEAQRHLAAARAVTAGRM